MALIDAIRVQSALAAFKAGMSASAWINEEREAGRPGRRTDLLKVFRNVNQLETKKDRLKYVRKDRFPSADLIAESSWEWQTEFAYKVKVESQLTPDEPLEERFVTILSDNPLTPGMIESQVAQKWSAWEKYGAEHLVTVTPSTAIHRIA